jgi:segregation and condensation protein A
VSEVEPNEPPAAGGYSVTLPMFEGPLDLLLHLCQKHELDILDIPIGFVTEKYLDFLAVMELMDLDVASEYLVMAATLAHIKSKMLLPAPPPGQEDEAAAEEEDPREALIRRLLEYQKYKQAGSELASRGVAGQDVFLRGMRTEEAVHTGLPPLAQVPLFSLVEAFQNILSKSRVKLTHDIVHERVTLADRINELVDILRVRRRIAFEDLFEDLTTRFDLVITFLALLEMTRLRMTRLFQADFNSQIYIEFTAQAVTEDGDAGDGVANGEAAASPTFDTEVPPAAFTGDSPFVYGAPPKDDGAATDDSADPLDTDPLDTDPPTASTDPFEQMEADPFEQTEADPFEQMDWDATTDVADAAPNQTLPSPALEQAPPAAESSPTTHAGALDSSRSIAPSVEASDVWAETLDESDLDPLALGTADTTTEVLASALASDAGDDDDSVASDASLAASHDHSGTAELVSIDETAELVSIEEAAELAANDKPAEPASNAITSVDDASNTANVPADAARTSEAGDDNT